MHRLVVFLLIILVPARVHAGTDDFTNAAVTYFTEAADLPLPPGFVELADNNVIFETAMGRILDLTALGSGQAENHAKIVQFYAETLPALGWIALKPMEFARDGERLDLRIVSAGRDAYLYIKMRPKP